MQNNNAVSNLAKKEQFRITLPHFELLQSNLFSFGFACQLLNLETSPCKPVARLHLLCFQSQGDDASDHGGRHGGAGVAVRAAVPEVRGDLQREELQPRAAGDAPGAGATPSNTPGLLGMLPAGS